MRLFLVLLMFLLATPSMADSWVFRPSRYSHNTQGERVSQYAPKHPAYVRTDPTYRQSGYRYHRQVVRGVDGNINRQYTVETWGTPYQPYYMGVW